MRVKMKVCILGGFVCFRIFLVFNYLKIICQELFEIELKGVFIGYIVVIVI